MLQQLIAELERLVEVIRPADQAPCRLVVVVQGGIWQQDGSSWHCNRPAKHHAGSAECFERALQDSAGSLWYSNTSLLHCSAPAWSSNEDFWYQNTLSW